MKQLFYAIAVIVLLFFAIRLMAKVKDVPEEDPKEESEEEFEPEHLENH
jgi:Na+-transporting methylmalonyl-CoA/oxaloacetate decarboxylase gamma subunit